MKGLSLECKGNVSAGRVRCDSAFGDSSLTNGYGRKGSIGLALVAACAFAVGSSAAEVRLPRPAIPLRGAESAVPGIGASGMPPVTLELKDAGIVETASRVGAALKTPLTLPPAPKPDAAEAKKLDYSARRSFSWSETPPARVLRDICKAFSCRVTPTDDGGFRLEPGSMVAGPEWRGAGFALTLQQISFRDTRTVSSADGDLTVTRLMGLDFNLRSQSGDVSSLYGLENVRVLDQEKRDVLDDGAAGQSTPYRHLPGLLPDERRQSFTFQWPYPNPRRFSRIEGDLTLFRMLRKAQIELRIPHPDEPFPVVNAEGCEFQFLQVQPLDEGVQGTLRIGFPMDTALEIASTSATAELADGSKIPARLEFGGYWVTGGTRVMQQSYSITEAKSRPVKLLMNVLVKSQPDQRTHFVFNNYPVEIDPRGAPPKPPAKRPASVGKKPAGKQVR